MKNVFIVLILSLIGLSAHSQAMIGKSLNFFKKECPNYKTEILKGDLYYTVEDELGFRAFYFENNINTYCMYVPTNEYKHEFIKAYNEKFIIKADRQWEAFISGGLLQVFLRLSDTKEWVFHYYFVQE